MTTASARHELLDEGIYTFEAIAVQERVGIHNNRYHFLTVKVFAVEPAIILRVVVHKINVDRIMRSFNVSNIEDCIGRYGPLYVYIHFNKETCQFFNLVRPL